MHHHALQLGAVRKLEHTQYRLCTVTVALSLPP